ADVVDVECGGDGEAAALLLRRRLVGGLRRSNRPQGAAGAAANLARTFVLFDFGDDAGRARRWRGRGLARRGRRRFRGCGGRSSGRARGGGFGLTKTLLGFKLGFALGLLLLPMAFLFGLAAGFGGLAFSLLDALAAGAALGLFLGLAAFLDFAGAGIGQCADSGGVLVLGERLQHHAGRPAGRLRDRRGGAPAERSLGGCGRALGRLGRSVLGLCHRPVTADPALAAFFDHDLLGAAMRKTLAHGAGLDARLERQGLALDTQFLVAGSILVGHSVVLILVVRGRTVV